MHPGARLQASIELLDEIDRTPRPADAVISAFFRARRFIGSKDRSAVAELVYGILRRHARLAWWIARAGHAGSDGRSRIIADEVLVRGLRGAELARLFDGGKFSPAPLSETEWTLAKALYGHTLEHPEMPEAMAVECPDWAEAPMRRALGPRFLREMEALLQPAPLDLRVNPIRGTREEALAALRGIGIRCEPTRWSPLGIRVQGRPPLAATEAFRTGLVEIQDEGSQLVTFVCDAKPGQQVVDFCSGAGGKALALGAAMRGTGRLIACDVLERRLERAAERFRRAGLHNIETRALSSERDPWVKRHKLRFDCVLVDAPCTGTGTWRRNPDSKWRPLGPGLSELVPIQAEILDSAARLVRPGGRLVYATCSMLPDENEDQVARFAETHPEFEVVPLPEVWAAALGSAAPCDGPYLSLSPARHDTDGFFAAALRRRA
ncbi:RsmB/NOP family class I SAM-dependent RNA methyltransferase [Arenibaculum pallidiluteum]|uniref:RsmB/NOP family class I SAM-dependent RNA methyltransferase n=1 Tax=Arenibaculum pallidiluteum TaxID=2812559 RepID=UPI001A974476|nr:RsmB/NOP family class I SAM-dependent RNA methyltransferase [Arenibaculum pallidiluteum]